MTRPAPRPREDVVRSLLSAAAAALLVAGVVVGCSSGSGSGDSATGSDSSPASMATGEPPTLTGAPDPASVPAPIWQAEPAGSDPLANFRDTPYNNDGAPAPTVVDSPNVAGHRAIRYTMPAGGKRTELEPQLAPIREGDEYWYGFAWYLPPEFPTAPGGWQVLAQWKNSGDGSPPVEVTVEDGQFKLDGGAGGDDPSQTQFSTPIGPARAGQQYNVVVHIVFSTDPGKAVVDVWQNGQRRLSGFRPPGGTRYESDDSYLKTGIYRDDQIEEPATLYLNDARVAKSYESAAALASPSTRR